jgi:photosystem II stability/assembly factor-like uncharacterized protein
MEASSSSPIRFRVVLFVTIAVGMLAMILVRPPVALAALTWTPQVSGTTENLNGVACVSATDAWAVGDSGTILYTTDGGAHWASPSPKDFSTNDDLLGVAFSDASNGWVVGDVGWIWATNDGGVHWTQQTSNTNASLVSVAFTDPSHGWAVGDRGTIVHTDDGGAHWAQQTSNTDASLMSVAFTDPSHGWAEGWDDTGTAFPYTFTCVIDHTDDGGKHWALQKSTTYTGYPPDNGSVTFVNASDGWAICGETAPVLHTTDGGAHWNVEANPTNANVVTFASTSDGWILPEYGGAILGTTDGGAHWTGESPDNTDALGGIAACDASHGWAVGVDGTILACKTTVTCTLAVPRVSGAATHKRSTTVSGSISPAHAATLTLRIQRKRGSLWKPYATRTVTTNGKGRWSAKIKLSAGTYRLCTSCKVAGDYSAATSKWGRVVVK